MDNNYKCGQDELYEACGVLQLNLVDEIGRFSAFKPKYNAAFATGFEAAIIAAAKLPDEEQRDATHELLLLDLITRQERCIDKLQALKLYMKDGYKDKDTLRIRMQQAGYNDYEQAANKNWEKLIAIMIHAKQFIHDNSADLLANDNMPATFENDFGTEESGLAPQILQFKSSQENSTVGTEDKISANNAIYDTAMGICEDGVYIFKKEEAKRNKFVWERIMDLITPPGAAGLRLDVKEDVTNLPLQGVAVIIQAKEGIALNATTDENGKAYFASLVVGLYKGKVELAGYHPLEVEFEIKTGVTSFKHWVMVKI